MRSRCEEAPEISTKELEKAINRAKLKIEIGMDGVPGSYVFSENKNESFLNCLIIMYTEPPSFRMIGSCLHGILLS